MNPDYSRLMAADEDYRGDLFAAAAIRLGTTMQNVEMGPASRGWKLR